LVEIYSGFLLGFPTYRFGIEYPANTDRKGWGHGDVAFLLNEKDERLLYSINKDELMVEKNTYALPFIFTRYGEVEKDERNRGEIRYAYVTTPYNESTVFSSLVMLDTNSN